VHATIRNVWPLLKETYNEWDRHQAPKLGAALSYYTVLSLAPLLIVVLTVVGIALGKEAARDEIIGQLQWMLGQQGHMQSRQSLRMRINRRPGRWPASSD
jgi:membrane protein